MTRSVAACLLVACLAPLAASAQTGPGAFTTPAPGTTTSTTVTQSCGPSTGTLSAAGQNVMLACPGASAYIIDITPTTGSPLIGTLSSTDSSTGAGRILFKAGVGSLGVASLPFTGVAGTTYEYRTVGGGYGQMLSLPAYTSGSASVSIYGTYEPSMLFINGGIETTEGIAVRQGRGFTTTTGLQMVTAGQYESLYIANPASSTSRVVLTNRQAYCDTPTGAVAPHWYSISDATVNIPATTAPIVALKASASGPGSVATAAYVASTTVYPDQVPSIPLASRVAGVVPTGGAAGGGPGTVVRTIEPGHSYAMTILGAANGLGNNPYCVMNFVEYEEPLQ